MVFQAMRSSDKPGKLRKHYKMLAFMPCMLAVTLAWAPSDELAAQLRLDYAALRAAEDDYRAQRAANALRGEEAADYAAWVAGLQRRVFEGCEALLASGSSYPDDLPCPLKAPPGTRPADIAVHSEMTPEEQVAALDARLMAGLGEYDERLLREKARIKSAAPNTNLDGGGAGAGMGGEGGAAGNGADTDANGRAADEAAADDGRGTGESGVRIAGAAADNSAGAAERSEASDPPADIADGGDDDVVARQLREAAEKETDSELKAKLWEEYRRYKSGTR
jgi:hypothetical protein